ncbi:MAG: hypothetical protein HY293_10480 [Planctomycetes bacterium]|nr:hypothetical protein [Planctomycetota bacterium]
MTFARRVFLAAGLYGLLTVTPQLFLEGRTSQDLPPAITHPEFYYGFVGAVLAWQAAFLIIASDPARYRPLMLAALIEKGVFAAAVPLLVAQGRVPSFLLAFAAIDFVLGLLFLEAWRRTAPTESPRDARIEERPGLKTDVLLLDLRRALDRDSDSRTRV